MSICIVSSVCMLEGLSLFVVCLFVCLCVVPLVIDHVCLSVCLCVVPFGIDELSGVQCSA